MNLSLKYFLGASFLLIICQSSYAKIWSPAILSDNMVLQQNSTVKIWGWTTVPNEEIVLKTTWSNKEYKTKAYQGKWEFRVVTGSSNTSQEITIDGHEKLKIKNILLGEVWLCAGQSNMEMITNWGILNAKEEKSKANHTNIRFFMTPFYQSDYPQDNLLGHWVECNPETMGEFSAVGYFFGKEIHEKLNTPVGLIGTYWGGSQIKTWMKQPIIETDKDIKEVQKKMNNSSWVPTKPGVIFNALIHPLLNFKIKGVIWYQGESNVHNPKAYYKSFPLMIESWRELWDQNFPFYYVQIAPYHYTYAENLHAEIIRDAQLKTLSKIEKTGMVVTNDIGNVQDQHPKNKMDVGKRLSLWALNKTYGYDDMVPSGPIYKAMNIQGNKIFIDFDYAENGLFVKGKKLREFKIAGKDQIFYEAKATVKGSKVKVWSCHVKKPVAVRFAYSNSALPNLYNTEGLPASAFRTDDWDQEEGIPKENKNHK